MALNDIERKKAEDIISLFVESIRPDESIRNKLDISYRIDGQSITIVELRPKHKDESVIEEFPVAKTTYVRSTKTWKIFWMRADLNWHSYPPYPLATKLEEFVKVVKEDEHCCFWG